MCRFADASGAFEHAIKLIRKKSAARERRHVAVKDCGRQRRMEGQQTTWYIYEAQAVSAPLRRNNRTS